MENSSRISIPILDLSAQNEALRSQLDLAIARVIDNSSYILGEEVAAFENEFAAYTGTRHCVAVANGTDALALSLRAIGVSPGDEVITTSHSASATAAAIQQIGAQPVFADIESDSLCICPKSISRVYSKRVKAIIVVHIYGQPAELDAIIEFGNANKVAIIEDCAQAHGACYRDKKVGGFGITGAFSFYPTKLLGALGDAGAIVTSDETIADRLRSLRQYGWQHRYISNEPGYNSRLDEMQAAILRCKLLHLEDWIEKRRDIAEKFSNSCSSSILSPTIISERKHAFHLYVVRCKQRDKLREYLSSRAIGTAQHYPVPLHQQPAFSSCRFDNDMQNTDALYNTMLTLPMYPELASESVDAICSALTEWEQFIRSDCND